MELSADNVERLLCKFWEHYSDCFYLREQSAGALEKGKEDRMITKTKVWEDSVWWLLLFFLISMVLNLSFTNICVWTKVWTCTFSQHHLPYRQGKGLNNQDFKKLFKKFSNPWNLRTHITIFSITVFPKVWFVFFSSQQYSCNYDLSKKMNKRQ